MKYLLKLFPEITVKSSAVRRQMIRALSQNLRTTLRRHDPGIRVRAHWDAIEVRPHRDLPAATREALEAAMARTAGLHEILSVEEVAYHSFAETLERLTPLWRPRLAGRRFCVRVKRRGDHDFRSEDLERYLGAGLLAAAEGARVDLTHPEEVVTLEVAQDRLRLVTRRRPGLGGYPLGTQGSALALMSGGYDSSVAAYRMLRRGIKVDYLFFNLGGPAHEHGVREVTHHLWRHYSASHRADFVSVPFEGVVAEILRTIPDGLMGVVLKRMMLRAASRMAQRARTPALVSGEAIAQVSSQSLHNLAMIDAVTDTLVLRPLATEDKQAIIDEARRLGTARFAETMPEYCGVISRRPHVKARPERIEAAEAAFDFAVLDRAVHEATRTRTQRLLDEAPRPPEGPIVDDPRVLETDAACRVIDIRHPDEREAAPLALPGEAPLAIPFFELQDRAAALPDDRHYLLYCARGVMSRMQAAQLHDRGLTHFGVYRPA